MTRDLIEQSALSTYSAPCDYEPVDAAVPDCSGWLDAEGYEWVGDLSFVVIVRQPLTCHPGGLRHVATVAGDDVESSWCLCAPDAAAPATPDELRRLAREVL